MIDTTDIPLEKFILNHFGLEYDLEAIKKFDKICFICGLSINKKTEEDLFPLWLIRELDLFGCKMALPNDTLFPFSQIKIPCCQKCNNEILSKLEMDVKKILEKDIENISKTDDDVLFKWFMKIFIGLWLKTTLIKSDLKNKNSDNLLPIISLEEAKPIYGLLKIIKYPVEFVNFQPYSIFKFKYSSTSDRPIAWISDFRFPSIAFAYKNSAFIISLNDDGIIRDKFSNMENSEFSNLEFPELILKFCEVVTAHELIQKNYHYLIFHNKQLSVNRVMLPENEEKSLILPWNVSILSKNLEYYFQKFGYKILINKKTGELKYEI